MKKTFAVFLSILMLFCSASIAFAEAENAEEMPVISWLTVGITLDEAIKLSPALVSATRNGVALSGGDFIATGDIITTKYGEYKALVLGDIVGDGKTNQYDYIIIKRHCFETYTLDESEFLAADINKDDTVDQYDYILAKRIYFETYKVAKPVNSDGVPVLLYHHMLEDEDKNTEKWAGNEITIATSEFRRHMQMLTAGGYNVVTADELVAYVRGEILLPNKSIMLCFDDGYKSNTYYAAPILREFGFSATMFAIMDFYDGEYSEEYDVDSLQHVTERDLESNSDVIHQQCHTYYNHNHLPEQSFNQIYDDLMLSQNLYKCDYFAYPYGDNNDTAVSAVKAAGFKAAFSTVERNATPGCDIYLIPRYTVISPMSDSDYLKLIAKAD